MNIPETVWEQLGTLLDEMHAEIVVARKTEDIKKRLEALSKAGFKWAAARGVVECYRITSNNIQQIKINK